MIQDHESVAVDQTGDNESESKISEETFDWLFHAMFVE